MNLVLDKMCGGLQFLVEMLLLRMRAALQHRDPFPPRYSRCLLLFQSCQLEHVHRNVPDFCLCNTHIVAIAGIYRQHSSSLVATVYIQETN